MDILVKPITGAPEELPVMVPGDKDIALRAILLAALADGSSQLTNVPCDADCLAATDVLRQAGCLIEERVPGELKICGRGTIFSALPGSLSCGVSIPTAKLMLGLLSGQPSSTNILGDATLHETPSEYLAEPLREVGAKVSSLNGDGRFPVTAGGSRLSGRNMPFPTHDAFTRDALALAGLNASDMISLLPSEACRDHVIRLLPAFGVHPHRESGWIAISHRDRPRSAVLRIPGNSGHAAFWIGLAAVLNIRIHLPGISLHLPDLAFTNLMIRMGVRIREEVETLGPGEWMGHLDIRGARLKGLEVPSVLVPAIAADLGILAVLAVYAEGKTILRGFRTAPQEYLRALCRNLRLMGASVEEYEDGFSIHGRNTLRGAELPMDEDPHLTMAFSLAGLLAEGESLLRQAGNPHEIYPDFFTSTWPEHFAVIAP